MKLDIKILWINDIGNSHHKGDIQTISVDCDYIEDHDNLIYGITDVTGDYVEGEDFEIINEKQFWDALMKDKHRITKEKVKKSLQVLIDNGIEEDEAQTVLQALGYTLLDMELEDFFK